MAANTLTQVSSRGFIVDYLISSFGGWYAAGIKCGSTQFQLHYTENTENTFIRDF